MFAVVIPGGPVAQPRARFSGMMKWSDKHQAMRPSARPYRDDKHPVHNYKKRVREIVAARLPADWNTAAPCAVGCVFVFPRIGKDPRRGGRVCKTSKPDNDNLVKAIWDALTGTVWTDDALIAAQFSVKLRAAPHEDAHTVVVFDQRPGSSLSGAWGSLVAGAMAGRVVSASNR